MHQDITRKNAQRSYNSIQDDRDVSRMFSAIGVFSIAAGVIAEVAEMPTYKAAVCGALGICSLIGANLLAPKDTA